MHSGSSQMYKYLYPAHSQKDELVPMNETTAKKRAIEMYLAGAKTADIEAKTGVARNALYLLLKKEGITPARIGQKPEVEKEAERLRTENETLREALKVERERVAQLLDLLSNLTKK